MALGRLDKILAGTGAVSRREASRAVRDGRVTVNGAVVTVPEMKIDPAEAAVALDGKVLDCREHYYYLLNKPAGVVCATEDRDQKTVLDLLPRELRRQGLFPVGRLDRDTRGLLLLTDDGSFAHRVISPSSNVEKTYEALTEGTPTEADAEAFAQGLVLGDGTRCLPARLEILGEGLCRVSVTEGKYHQVRRMLASRGTPVKDLRRISEGMLTLPEGLAEGDWMPLGKEELCRVFMVR